MKYIQKILLYLQYGAAVTAAVKAVEEQYGDIPGQDKKALVMAYVEAAVKVGETIPDEHVAIISALIDQVVATLNAIGVFKVKSGVAKL